VLPGFVFGALFNTSFRSLSSRMLPYRVAHRYVSCVATVQTAFGYLANSLHAAF